MSQEGLHGWHLRRHLLHSLIVGRLRWHLARGNNNIMVVLLHNCTSCRCHVADDSRPAWLARAKHLLATLMQELGILSRTSSKSN